MITNQQLREVKLHLEKAELTNRKIAKLVGVNRATVNKIADGWQPRTREIASVKEWRRCPDCGWWVTWPCIYCRIKPIALQLARQKSQA